MKWLVQRRHFTQLFFPVCFLPFLPNGLIYHSAKIVLIGTGDLYIAVKENKRIKRKRGDLFQAPEVGDFAVHEVHGIGYVKGVIESRRKRAVKIMLR